MFGWLASTRFLFSEYRILCKYLPASICVGDLIVFCSDKTRCTSAMVGKWLISSSDVDSHYFKVLSCSSTKEIRKELRSQMRPTDPSTATSYTVLWIGMALKADAVPSKRSEKHRSPTKLSSDFSFSFHYSSDKCSKTGIPFSLRCHKSQFSYIRSSLVGSHTRMASVPRHWPELTSSFAQYVAGNFM